MAKLYADENYSYRTLELLEALGHDILTAQKVERANQGIDDIDVLIRATELGPAVITDDRHDYHRLHRIDPNHAGIVSCTEDRDKPALAARIHAALIALTSLDGQLIKIYRPSTPRPKRSPQ